MRRGVFTSSPSVPTTNTYQGNANLTHQTQPSYLQLEEGGWPYHYAIKHKIIKYWNRTKQQPTDYSPSRNGPFQSDISWLRKNKEKKKRSSYDASLSCPTPTPVTQPKGVNIIPTEAQGPLLAGAFRAELYWIETNLDFSDFGWLLRVKIYPKELSIFAFVLLDKHSGVLDKKPPVDSALDKKKTSVNRFSCWLTRTTMFYMKPMVDSYIGVFWLLTTDPKRLIFSRYPPNVPASSWCWLLTLNNCAVR